MKKRKFKIYGQPFQGYDAYGKDWTNCFNSIDMLHNWINIRIFLSILQMIKGRETREYSQLYSIVKELKIMKIAPNKFYLKPYSLGKGNIVSIKTSLIK